MRTPINSNNLREGDLPDNNEDALEKFEMKKLEEL